mgnify:CR=1 FL=1
MGKPATIFGSSFEADANMDPDYSGGEPSQIGGSNNYIGDYTHAHTIETNRESVCKGR